MNSNYNAYPVAYSGNQITNDDNRIGFLGPFILGGITGGLIAPAFTGGYNRPYYYNNYYYYPPYRPYYPPYYNTPYRRYY